MEWCDKIYSHLRRHILQVLPGNIKKSSGHSLSTLLSGQGLAVVVGVVVVVVTWLEFPFTSPGSTFSLLSSVFSFSVSLSPKPDNFCKDEREID